MEETHFTKEEIQQVVDKAMPIVLNRAGDFIKKLRTSNNMSIRDLAHKSGVSPAVISELECYKSLPKIEVLLKLATALNVKYEIMLSQIWLPSDSDKLVDTCGKPPIKLLRDITFYRNEAVHTSLPNDIEESFILDRWLAQEGLTSTDIKEIFDYIEYRKFKKKSKCNKK